ncbi:MAG: B12-binding domain-containing radical SAM protein [Methanoregula sp.]|nr:B12-binding domain-containing radical SAM protein [Methanoregula sp.]
MPPIRVLFIASEDEENLSVRYPAAALTRAGYTIDIAPFSVPKDTERVLKQIKKSHPDLIAISMAFQSKAPVFFELIKAIRKTNYNGHITVGGHFPTFEYRKILEAKMGINSVVRFEGEQALVELAESLEGKRELSSVSNLVYWIGSRIKENPVIDHFPDLDALPFPVRNDRPQVRLGENFATLVASRGCWHAACAYCCIGAFHAKKKGPRYALRSVENIAQEIAWLYHKQGIRLFQFHDDNFLQAREADTVTRLDGLMAALEKENVDPDTTAFLIKARPDSITREVAFRLGKLGVVGVFLGVENASESGLEALIRGSDCSHIDRAFELLFQHGIIITYNLLIFHPDATLNEVNTNILFMKNHPGFPFDFGRAEVVAGSPLEYRVIKDGLIKGNWPNWDYRIKDPAVDQMFRINLATFRRPEGAYSKLAHTLIALAYRARVVHRLYPGPAAQQLNEETGDLICRSNRVVLEQILKMYTLTARLVSKKDLDELAGSINTGCLALIKEADALTKRMDRLQMAEKKFRQAGVPGEVQHSSLLRKILRV